MGYLLDYELFTPCSNCGSTQCNGNSCRDRVRGPRVTHGENFQNKSTCDCHVCRNMREREENRNARELSTFINRTAEKHHDDAFEDDEFEELEI